MNGLAAEGFEDPGEHELLAPTLIRSQLLSTLHEMVHRGELPAEVATDRLARVARIPMRLLGDSAERRAAGTQARAFVLAQQGATARTLDLLGTLLVSDAAENAA